MADLKSKNINAGDPVTAELINSIILDLNEINKGSTISTITLANTTASGSSTTVSSTVQAVGPQLVSMSGGSTVTEREFKFAKPFAEAPKCWVQIYTEGLDQPTFAQSQVFPQVTLVTTTSAKVKFRTSTSTKLKVVLFATGVLA